MALQRTVAPQNSFHVSRLLARWCHTAPTWNNTFLQQLPWQAGDASDSSRRHVIGSAGTLTQAQLSPAPELLAWSEDLAHELQLCDAAGHLLPSVSSVLCGAAQADCLPGAGHVPHGYAHVYGGHQFGHWARQLGDGRAMGIGEVQVGRGTVELQLKGAGPTPFSRSADGRAVLRSSLREFVASEFMHGQGIPTTRGLTLATTGQGVLRDVHYSGHLRLEPGAILCRSAPGAGLLRVGSVEWAVVNGAFDLAMQYVEFSTRHTLGIATQSEADVEQAPEADALAPLAEAYALYARSSKGGALAGHSIDASDTTTAQHRLEFLKAWLQVLGAQTGALAAAWHGIGFVHGVLNTDNTSLAGITLDYGPYGFMERCALCVCSARLAPAPHRSSAAFRRFDPMYTPNTSDPGSRYCFMNQPLALAWNLARLAGCLFHVVDESGRGVSGGGSGLTDSQRELAQSLLDAVDPLPHFREAAAIVFGSKMAVGAWQGPLPDPKAWLEAPWGRPPTHEPGDAGLLQDVFLLMHRDECDWTNTWEVLGQHVPAQETLRALARRQSHPLSDAGWLQVLQRLHERQDKSLHDTSRPGTGMASDGQPFVARLCHWLSPVKERAGSRWSPPRVPRNYQLQACIAELEASRHATELTALLAALPGTQGVRVVTPSPEGTFSQPRDQQQHARWCDKPVEHPSTWSGATGWLAADEDDAMAVLPALDGDLYKLPGFELTSAGGAEALSCSS